MTDASAIKKWHPDDVNLLNMLSTKIDSKVSRFRSRLLKAAAEELAKQSKEAEAEGRPVPDKRIQEHFGTESSMAFAMAETSSGKFFEWSSMMVDGPYIPIVNNVLKEINAEGLRGG